jgi:transcriptional regulator GlxA family with amidase domain
MRFTASPHRLAHPFLALQSGESNQDSPRLTQLDRRVQHVIERFQADLAKPYYLKELAAIIHLSPRQLERLFQQETKSTPLQYLKRLRLEQAANLLLTTDKDIKEIRLLVGYKDASQFGADFKRLFGCTPQQFRPPKTTE